MHLPNHLSLSAQSPSFVPFRFRYFTLCLVSRIASYFPVISDVHYMLLIFYTGGTGAMAYTLCQYYPNMKITVCELQSVIDCSHHFRPSSEDCPNQGNVSYVVGNFLQADLPKADLYILCRVLPDWPEEKVGLILSNAFKCLSPGNSFYCWRNYPHPPHGRFFWFKPPIPICKFLFSCTLSCKMFSF